MRLPRRGTPRSQDAPLFDQPSPVKSGSPHKKSRSEVLQPQDLLVVDHSIPDVTSHHDKVLSWKVREEDTPLECPSDQLLQAFRSPSLDSSVNSQDISLSTDVERSRQKVWNAQVRSISETIPLSFSAAADSVLPPPPVRGPRLGEAPIKPDVPLRLPLHETIARCMVSLAEEVANPQSSEAQKEGWSYMPVGKFPKRERGYMHRFLVPSGRDGFDKASTVDPNLSFLAPAHTPKPTSPAADASLAAQEEFHRQTLSILSSLRWFSQAQSELVQHLALCTTAAARDAFSAKFRELQKASEGLQNDLIDRTTVDLSTATLARRDLQLETLSLVPDDCVASLRAAPFVKDRLFDGRAPQLMEKTKALQLEANSLNAGNALGPVKRKSSTKKSKSPKKPKVAATSAPAVALPDQAPFQAAAATPKTSTPKDKSKSKRKSGGGGPQNESKQTKRSAAWKKRQSKGQAK